MMETTALCFRWLSLPVEANITKQDLLNGLGDEEVTRYYGIHLSNQTDAEKQIQFYETLIKENRGQILAVFLDKSEKELIGIVAWHYHQNNQDEAELSYWLLKKHQGKGYSKVALNYFIEHCKKQSLPKKLFALIIKENLPSIKLIQSLGFLHTHTDTEAKNRFGEQVTDYVYRLEI